MLALRDAEAKVSMDDVMAEAVAMAIRIAGGTHGLAELIGVSPQSVHAWGKRGRIPVGRVLLAERITGIPRSKFRPDIYPPRLEKKRKPMATNTIQDNGIAQ
jgi:DNA-binding transcriptional regulator YdaS (Cro superfamily)